MSDDTPDTGTTSSTTAKPDAPKRSAGKRPAGKTAAKPGRPKAAKPKDDPTVTERPPACPRCKSTRRTQRQHLRTHYHSGDGYHHRTTWGRVFCLDCGQTYRVARTESQLEPFTGE